jgi:hypothetical protein
MNLASNTKLSNRVFLLGQDDQVWTWGNQANNSLLLLTEQEYRALEHVNNDSLQATPRPILGLPCATRDIKKIAAGRAHVLLLTKDEKVYAWGCNSRGQLGISPKISEKSLKPVLVDLPGGLKLNPSFVDSLRPSSSQKKDTCILSEWVPNQATGPREITCRLEYRGSKKSKKFPRAGTYLP